MAPGSADSAVAMDSAVTEPEAQCSASDIIAAVRTIWLLRYATMSSNMCACTSGEPVVLAVASVMIEKYRARHGDVTSKCDAFAARFILSSSTFRGVNAVRRQPGRRAASVLTVCCDHWAADESRCHSSAVGRVASITAQLACSLPVSVRSVPGMGSYDYVVVGGGTAGCVVAARLSEDPGARVLLVEAGSRDGTDAMSVPAKWLTLLDSDVDWGFRTVPQAGLDGAVLGYPRGRVLGGSSGINAMTHLRADRSSYDRWAADGASGWGFDDLLPYFRRAENAMGRDPHLRGTDGPLTVEPNVNPHPAAEAFFAACTRAGLPGIPRPQRIPHRRRLLVRPEHRRWQTSISRRRVSAARAGPAQPHRPHRRRRHRSVVRRHQLHRQQVPAGTLR